MTLAVPTPPNPGGTSSKNNTNPSGMGVEGEKWQAPKQPQGSSASRN